MNKMKDKQEDFIQRFYFWLGVAIYLILLIALAIMLKIHGFV
tara:strand:- start:1288 stop:1413 length:126 start_codon:yes stop_codon:yes gene_type:complete